MALRGRDQTAPAPRRSADDQPEPHPRATEPATLLVTVLLSVLGAVIGMQILVTLGITPNTALVGVLIAVALSRVPLPQLRRFRSVHRQNLVQTNISSATFGAANSLLLPVGVPALMGRPDLVPTMLFGASLGMLIDLAMLYWFFDSRLFPGSGPWPHGVAAAEAILGAEHGGRRAAVLGVGAAGGIVGASGLFGLAPAVPMSAFGVALIGNVAALSMFGVGLLVRAYSPALLGLDLNAMFVPHGVMVGAGLVALTQAVGLVARGRRRDRGLEAVRAQHTRSDAHVRAALLWGTALYVAAAALLAALGGLWTELPPAQLLGWIAFAATACIAAEFIVGFSAMQAGWFPAFATALIFLVIGLLLGFPPAASALLVGFVASGGPAFADAGYDLKAGWHLRGGGTDPRLELDGRRQQIIAGLVGLLTALVMVALFHDLYFTRDLFPPVDRVYAATIRSGIDPSVVRNLALWVIPGAVLQLLGGTDRQLGILLGTGLLILNAAAGWAVLAGIVARLVLDRTRAVDPETATVVGAGCIAGDALWGFGHSVARAVLR